MDKMVEIARFTYPAEAQTLLALLRAEGIDCYLRNELSSQIMAGYVDVGGARVEILEKDLPRALEIMREGGYLLPGDDDLAEPAGKLARLTRHIPLLQAFPAGTRILLLFLLAAISIALAIYAASLLFSN